LIAKMNAKESKGKISGIRRNKVTPYFRLSLVVLFIIH